MIISHKYKYLFAGHPYCASSAISRELVKNYHGKPILSKHSIIPTFIKIHSEIDIHNYFIFAVVKNPVDIAFTAYNKILFNQNNIYTNPSYFSINGGFISNKKLRIFKKVQKNMLSFQQYLRTVYKYHPYDNDLSINLKYLNGIIRFDYLDEDFNKILTSIGIRPKRTIPIFNKTEKKIKMPPLSKQDIKTIFGPFYSYNKLFNFSEIEISPIRNAMYKLYQTLRFIKRLKIDISTVKSGKFKDAFLK